MTSIRSTALFMALCSSLAFPAAPQKHAPDTLRIANGKIAFSVMVQDSLLAGDMIKGAAEIHTDADFSFQVMWTDWQAPNRINNAENPVDFSKKDFKVVRRELRDTENGGKQLTLDMANRDIPLQVRLAYRLDANAFYVRRRVSVSDTAAAGHFLQYFSPMSSLLTGKYAVRKPGGFGQPVAVVAEKPGKGGGFFGVEYPAADNAVAKEANGLRVTCRHEMGEKIGRDWLESEWAVEGLSPDSSVKLWFMKYVDDIRVARLRPYTLYNSWYDLRSPEYPKVPQGNWMNEKNVFHIIDLLRTNMITKHDIKVDAFVLDDGWDVYESDWQLRRQQFPNGLAPVADELRKSNTSLGMWLGPTGGYSFRMRRINWMKDHGYEVVGSTPNTAMLCLGGTVYSRLFRKRVEDFVQDQHIGYFKWDGIQFSCSEPGHGHPVGIYSRRAILNSLIEDVKAVRAKRPDIFLNITSGTWLSPWWVQYANTIWMQGADYGYADVPSISPRDAAITYRDFVLYDDFRNQNMWFPIANLMTHGIIKGNLEWLGGKAEPLDKFTNEVLLYFARGVAMWELYISPDILSDGEWDALAQAMQWAKDRFPLLENTEMVGGDPTKGQTYGYVHFREKKGIIAARNPLITPGSLNITLASSAGLDPAASDLVIEQVYPYRWISPRLYAANATVTLPLDGYETAIYEIYPVGDAAGPLVAGVPFSIDPAAGSDAVLSVYGTGEKAKLLNSSKYKLDVNPKSAHAAQDPVTKIAVTLGAAHESMLMKFDVDASVQEAKLAILLTPGKESLAKKLPQVQLTVDGKADTAQFERAEGENLSVWYTIGVQPGRHEVTARIVSRKNDLAWSGSATSWLICKQKQIANQVTRVLPAAYTSRPMPPLPLPAGVMVRNVKLGGGEMKSSE